MKSALALDALPGRIAVPRLPPSRVLFSVAAEGPTKAAETGSSCRVRLFDGKAGPRDVAHLDVASGEEGWVDAEATLPALTDAELEFDCESPGTNDPRFVWAMPIAMPVKRPEPAPLIVLLDLDTLRADRVAGFGGTEEQTPHLARLGAEGRRLVEATADGAWTPTSTFSLLFSRFLIEPRSDDPLSFPEPTSLARALSAGGYTTVALTGGGYVSVAMGFGDGFDHFATPRDLDSQHRLDEKIAGALAWIDRVGDAPLFLFLHSYFIHQAGPDAEAWKKAHGRSSTYRPNRDQTRRSIAFYDELVRRADAHLASLFDPLRRIAHSRPVMVVVVSDHGEAFMEHGRWGHGGGSQLYEELLRIPVIVWSPDRVVPGVDRTPTMLADVAPSILGAAGLEAPESMRGRNDWSRWSDPRAELPPQAGRGSVSANRRHWSLREPPRKLLVRKGGTVKANRAGLVAALYDLEDGSNEGRDLSKLHPDETRAMLERLATELEHFGIGQATVSWIRSGRPPPIASARSKTDESLPPVDEETREELKALGYLE